MSARRASPSRVTAGRAEPEERSTGEASRGEVRTIRSAAVYSHRLPEVTSETVKMLIEGAEDAGVELRFNVDEKQKHELDGARYSALTPEEGGEWPDVCIVLGGDGTTLRSLRGYAGTDVPVFSINCGHIGFLATVDRDQAQEGVDRALSGRFEVIKLPSLLLDEGPQFALNEVSFQRGSHMNVAQLSYSLSGEKVAGAPCDGLIASTPLGSTAYNLSAGGPILSWDLRGFVVSMVAPHALSARSLVVSPEDVLRVANEGSEAVDVVIDGMRAGELGPGEGSSVAFKPDAVGLAQLPGSSFYSRYREKLRLLTG
jgi:NAD+ kinase